MQLIGSRRSAPASLPAGAQPGLVPAAARALVAGMCFELLPTASIDRALAELPPAASVTVTCSPALGITATQEATSRLIDRGHRAVPHLAARLVQHRDHVARIAGWLRARGVGDVFVIAGDAGHPVGPYHDAMSLLADLLEHDAGITHVGVPAYPDGHPFISRPALHEALLAKQALLGAAGLRCTATTQMCLDPARVRQWLVAERRRGVEVPVQFGIPGVVERMKLMRMGVRIGVGTSLRYLKKHRGIMTAMLAPGGFDPTELLAGLPLDGRLGVTGLHAFTFNSVGPTVAWQRAVMTTADGM